eukprot:6179046-Pleurochrysis_carterae.AAC.1
MNGEWAWGVIGSEKRRAREREDGDERERRKERLWAGESEKLEEVEGAVSAKGGTAAGGCFSRRIARANAFPVRASSYSLRGEPDLSRVMVCECHEHSCNERTQQYCHLRDTVQHISDSKHL